MRNKNTTTIIIIIVFVVLGFSTYQFLENYQITKNQTAGEGYDQLINSLKAGLDFDLSGTIRSEVVSISDRTLILKTSKGVLPVRIEDDASVSYLIYDQSPSIDSPKPQFSDIKIGDEVSIKVILRGEELIVNAVIILP